MTTASGKACLVPSEWQLLSNSLDIKGYLGMVALSGMVAFSGTGNNALGFGGFCWLIKQGRGDAGIFLKNCTGTQLSKLLTCLQHQ